MALLQKRIHMEINKIYKSLGFGETEKFRGSFLSV